VFRLFDFSLQLNGFPMKEAQVAFDKILVIPEEKYQRYIETQRNEIVTFHLKNNLFYQNLVGKNTIENWNDLPVLTKKDLQKPLKERLFIG